MKNLESNTEFSRTSTSGANSGHTPRQGAGNHDSEQGNSSNKNSSDAYGKPAWMSDPLVKEIPAKKLQFLEELFAQGQGKSQKELMAFFMPAMKRARQENLTFTPQEVSAAIAAIKKYSSAEELKKIDKILEKSKQGGK
ncbi:MAG: hypothetical protein HFH85_17985 [Lachnospiraceae bacterium]|jgi:hypothetical protein|nr:hypothetical protein [Lachnospiraceae bacterium]